MAFGFPRTANPDPGLTDDTRDVPFQHQQTADLVSFNLLFHVVELE